MGTRSTSRKAAVLRLADKVVRGYAVAAMLSCGFPAAAAMLRGVEEIDDDSRRARAGIAVMQATTQVLSAPADADGERALVALVATQEALAMAAALAPSDAHVEELMIAAAVVEGAASDFPRRYVLHEREPDAPA